MNASPAKTIAVTGITSGIGLEIARQLLARGYHLAAIARSVSIDPDLVAAQGAGSLRYYAADLADFAQLDVALDRLVASEPELDGLINNAGISLGGPGQSPQGRDIHFEINTLVPYVIARRLEPLLAASGAPRIVNVSSNAALMVRRYVIENLANPASFKKLTGPYATSKLALSLWTSAIAPQLAAKGIGIVSADPGGNRTPMTEGDGMPWFLKHLPKTMFSHPSVGASRIVDAFERPGIEPGAFLVKGRKRDVPFSGKAADTLALVSTLAEGVDEPEYLT